MKRDDKFLDPIAEEDKSQVFTDLANERVSSNDSERTDDVLESPEYAEAYKKLLERIIPAIDIRDPSGWAVYGSAEKYYENAYEYIHNSYPYDGSALEKVNWTLSASAVDLAVLQHEYPLAVGHVGFSTSSWGSLNGSKSGLYGLSNTPEYIKFSGGPYVGSVFDSTTKRDSSLKIDPSTGNTVEFWLRKNSFISNSLTESEIIFDSHTKNFAEGNAKYGRFLLELQDASNSPLYVTYMSGTVGADRQQIGQNLTAADVADGKFHHYAITSHHTGSSLNIELYIDGAFNHRITVSTATFGPVTDYFDASIGALRTTKDSNGGLGYGKLSGSIDEFRFWKIKRTAEQIGNYYDVSVYGATDKELINSDLSVYYKFNEGIAGSETRDKVILDYSGRMNNGEFVGYAAAARSEKSAIDITDVTELTEVGDPIIDPKSSRVVSTLENLKKLGQEYDKFNHASLFKSVPNWAFDVNSGASNLNSDFSILLQGIAQRFDSIRMLIADLPKVGITQFNDFVNSSGSIDYSQNFYNILGCTGNWDLTYKRYHSENKYSVQNLLAKGFDVGELPIINQATLNEYFNNLRFNKKDYVTNLANVLIDSKVEAVKDKILNSIHANLMAVYKRKGTKESFRNLIRCFGVDEDLLAFNVYGQNIEKIITDTPVYESLSIKSFAFTGSNINTTIYQTASQSDERHYIQGKAAPSSMTLEANVLFPKIIDVTKTAVTTSVFGMNAVSSSSNVVTSDNYAGLVVRTIKNNTLQTGCRFQLSSSAGLWTAITTDYFSEVYSNTPWYLAVRFSEDTSSPLLNSDNRGTQTYKVDFIGYRYDQDVRTSMFEETATITQANYQNFISANKGIFLGANRATIGGSVTNQSDCKILSFSAWDDALETSEMQEHAKSVENLGRNRPLQQPNDNQGAYTTKADKLIINWLFDSVSNLNTSTTYVFDRASGSLGNVAKFGNIVGHKYPGVTFALQHQNGSIQQEFIPSVKYLPIDNLESESRIEVKDREIESFQINSRPISYLYSFEKSMYQVISKEMLNMLAGATAFNNIIGEPVYKYRQEYKSLEKLRERFFSKVENTIDLEGFIEYYKWIDSSLSLMLKQIQPATTDMNLNLEDVIESHAFERSKYKHQAPQFEYKDPKLVGQILGVNELLYDWEHGHAPLSNNEADNCLWWSDRANRITNKFVTSSSDSANKDREDLRQRGNTVVSGSTYVLRKLSRPYNLSAQRLRTFEIGSNRNANKNKDLHRVIVATDKQIQVNKSDINEFKQCRDVLNPQEEKLYTAKTNTTGTDGYLDADADMILPFSLYSSSAGNDFSIFKENLKITNNHDDQRSVLQSTHMRSLVGGMPHRRVKFGTSDANRPEAYLLSASADVLTLKAHPSSPKSYTARGLGIQSPYNLTNIKQNTGSSPVTMGNYVHDYDIVQTSGRSVNNSHITENGLAFNTSGSLGYIAGMPDFTSPVRARAEHVFVNKFNSPGGPETQGVYGRDKESGEYSIYNTLNYRNLSVRQPLDLLSTERSEQFGFRSGSSVNASLHMVHRNFFYGTKSSGQIIKPDNHFVQHEIPQNDFSYSWITASAVNSKFDFVRANDGFGHQHMFNSASAKAIQFVSASQATASIDFVGMSLVVVDSLITGSNTLSGSTSNSVNNYILNRQGPYGWPSWKQIRGGQHPIIRAHRKTNTFTRVFLSDPETSATSIAKSRNTPSMNLAAQTHPNISSDAYERARFLDSKESATVSRVIKSYTEVPVTEKFNSVRMIMHGVDAPNGAPQDYASTLDFRLPQYFLSKNEGIPNLVQSDRESNWNFNRRYYQKFDIPQRRIVFKNETMQNDLTTFANQQIIIDTEYEEQTDHKFFDGAYRFLSSADTLGTLIELNYAETIYPKEVNVFTDNTRNRSSFDYFPWKSSREIRNIALTGNVTHNLLNTMMYLTGANGFYAFSQFDSNNVKDFKKSIFGRFDILNIARLSETQDLRMLPYHITMSSWPLDARKDFTIKPVNMDKSFLAEGLKMFTGSSGRQGTFGEGILQNDFSTFPLGMNNMYGTPPISMVYNRRIPQTLGTNAVHLAGEAKWEAGDNNKGPFYDSYSDYSQDIKNVAPDHTIVPEFRMSEFVEEAINRTRDYPNVGDDFLILTGAIYQNSSGDVDVGGTFFKTYSNSDFLKYFSTYEENLLGDISDPEQNLSHGRINFKCKAAMKFLPYKGFYPAERTVELAKLFHDNYISDSVINSANISPPEGSGMSNEQAIRYSKLRANASRYQATKPLFGPGILFNSIKSGLAVDYPVFSASFGTVYKNLPELTIMTNMGILDMPVNKLFTGSMINGSTGSSDTGIPRLTSSANAVKRIEFEDLLSPTNIFGEAIYDNEPHPSASLIYGNQHFHKIIERPGFFGRFNEEDAQKRLGLNFTNTRRAFSRQISPYTLASQNFAAESVNFFLEDGHLTTAISKPIRERFEAGTYKMRVHLNNVDTVMYDRDSAFGPPVDDGAGGVTLKQYTRVASTATRPNVKFEFFDHHGSGGSVQYNIAATASNHLPQLVFTDESNKKLRVVLYNSDYYTPPSSPTSTSGDIKMYLHATARTGVLEFLNTEELFVLDSENLALIDVKDALGSEVATSVETALDNTDLGLDVITNRAGSVLAISSSVFGPRQNFNYRESVAGSAIVNVTASNGIVYGINIFTGENVDSNGNALRGTYLDGTSGFSTYKTNIYSGSSPVGLYLDNIIDGVTPGPELYTTSSVISKTEHGFAPFTPPFLDPNSSPYVEVSFTVSEAAVFSAQEIIEKSTFEYYNFHTAPSNATSNTNYRHSMALSASLNLGMCVTLRTDNLEQIEGHGADGNAGNFSLREVDPNNLLQRWVIQTKWETPIMDFSQVTASAYNLASDTVTQVSGSPWKTRYWDTYYERGLERANVTSGNYLTGSTGMWHQKGTTLDEKDAKGYFLSIKDVPQANGAGGLAEKLGFNTPEERSAGALKRAKEYRSRIGLVEDRKIVKEAIVAIPYVLREDLGNKIEFVRLSNAYYELARQNVASVRNQMKTIPLTDRILTIEDYNSFRAEMDGKAKTPLSDAPIDAIEYQLFMMDEYILPPQFDFTRVPRNAAAADIPDPFMIYFFQFHASFNREDLSNIWQNLYPKSPGSTASARYSYTNEKLLGRLRAHNDVSYVSHYLDTVDLNGAPLCPAEDPRALFSPEGDNKTRWLVFKVKQRGMNSLEQVRRKSIDPRLENIESLQYLAEAKSSENALTLPRNIPGRREDGTMDLQFNWPYDYFSFVELIKLEAKIDSFNYKK